MAKISKYPIRSAQQRRDRYHQLLALRLQQCSDYAAPAPTAWSKLPLSPFRDE